MTRTLTRSYELSASFTKGARVIGRNFRLAVTVDALDEAAETRLDEAVRHHAVEPAHTRDWDQSPDFLLTVGREDYQLLEAFWGVLRGPLAAFHVRRIELHRDENTRTTLEP